MPDTTTTETMLVAALPEWLKGRYIILSNDAAIDLLTVVGSCHILSKCEVTFAVTDADIAEIFSIKVLL